MSYQRRLKFAINPSPYFHWFVVRSRKNEATICRNVYSSDSSTMSLYDWWFSISKLSDEYDLTKNYIEFDQSRTVWSLEAETIVLPLGWRAKSVTGALCPMNLKGRFFFTVDRFQTITALSYDPDMIWVLLDIGNVRLIWITSCHWR